VIDLEVQQHTLLVDLLRGAKTLARDNPSETVRFSLHNVTVIVTAHSNLGHIWVDFIDDTHDKPVMIGPRDNSKGPYHLRAAITKKWSLLDYADFWRTARELSEL